MIDGRIHCVRGWHSVTTGCFLSIAVCVLTISLMEAHAADIMESATGAASGTDWNQGSQWADGLSPTSANTYVLHTNTSNNSTLASYYGVSFGNGYIRTPVNGSASVFSGGSLIVPPGTEILLKESNGGSASANIVFRNYNNINLGALYPLIRLGPNTAGGTVTLAGTITNLVDSYIGNDAGGAMTLKIASAVSGVSNLTLISSVPGTATTTFSSTRTNFVAGDWSGFSGALSIGNSIVAGVAELSNAAVNVNMALVMPRGNAVLQLDKGICVKSFSISNHVVPAGTYTPLQLAALGFGGNFSGSGSLTVGFTAPPSLTAVPRNAHVKLSWSAVYGAASYNVNRSTASGAEATITNITGTTFMDLNLVNETTYYYTVSAIDGLGSESADAVEVSATPTETTASPGILKVFLQGGQSNSDGRAVTNGLSARLLNPQNDVLFYYYLTGGVANGDGTLGALTALRPGASALGGGTTFGPELTFGRTQADYFAVSNGAPTNTVMVAIIKYAHGGTSLFSDWAANGNSSTNGDGPDYLIFQQVVRSGLARLAQEFPDASLELSGMIWVQGETDIDLGATASAAYGTNLVRFINDVRQTWATNRPFGANLPFFLSRISANQTVYSNPADADYPNYLSLRAGQQYAAMNLDNVFLVDIDAPQFSTATPWSSPGLHFDTQGQQSLGATLGQQAIRSLPAPHIETSEKQGDALHLEFTGVSGTVHSVTRSGSIIGPWTVLTNIVVGATGMVTYDDLRPLYPFGFYRIIRP